MAADADVEVDDEAELLLAGAAREAVIGWLPARARSFGAVAQDVGRARHDAAAAGSGANCGSVTPASPVGAFSMRTRRSYQAAWPVTGSALA